MWKRMRPFERIAWVCVNIAAASLILAYLTRETSTTVGRTTTFEGDAWLSSLLLAVGIVTVVVSAGFAAAGLVARRRTSV